MLSVNEQLQELSDKIDLMFDLLVKTQSRSYNLKNFCEELGISQYKLKSYYSENKLSIPAPFRVNKQDPCYSLEDLIYMKKWLKHHGN